MPKNKDFFHRIEIIDECLRRRNKKWSIDELLECVNAKLSEQFRLEISKRTLQYDLEHLVNEMDAPLEKVKEGAKVFYRYSDVNYSIKNLPLSDEEIIRLKDAISLLKEVGNLSFVQDLDDIVNKLENTITASEPENRAFIQVEKHSAAEGTEYLDDLFTAIKEKLVLRVTYQPFGKEPYEWLVHPYLLKEYRNRWFLIARNQHNNKLTNLALDRIRSIKNTRESFIENDLFDPSTYYNNLIGVTFPEGEVVQDITLRIKANQVPYVQTKPIHFTQDTIEHFEDGSIIIRLRLINNYELRSVLLGYGGDVEVLEPASLREQIKVIFREGYKQYE